MWRALFCTQPSDSFRRRAAPAKIRVLLASLAREGVFDTRNAAYPQAVRRRSNQQKSITMSEEETPEKFYGLKHITLTEDDLDNLMFIGSASKLKEFLKAADNCIETVKQSGNIRLIVLETWLFLDFGVRELLVGALDSAGINHEDYDLRYYALPRNFRACTDLLVKIKQTNEKLPPDPRNNAITLPIRFLFFLKREHPQLFGQLMEAEQQYYQRYYPKLVTSKETANIYTMSISVSPNQQEYRHISENWLKATSRIDDDWRKKAVRLDDARNYAAHSYDTKKISERMGYAGENVEQRIRNECLSLIEHLLGIVPKV